MARLSAAWRYARRRMVLALVNLLAPPLPVRALDRVRHRLLALTGMTVGDGTFISSHLFVFDGSKFAIGRGGSLGSFARIWDFAPVEIGDNLLCSHGLTIVAGTHETAPPYQSLPGPVTIGRDVWIGVNVTIVGPCHIPDGTIVGANSFVTGMLAQPGVYGGSPARLKRPLAVPDALS